MDQGDSNRHNTTSPTQHAPDVSAHRTRTACSQLLVGALVALGFGCADASLEQEPWAEAASSELQLGDRGPEVRELHDILHHYGYFPNDALAEQYPSWRPVVLESPRDPSVFDSVIERAVEHFQTNYAFTADRCGR